MKKRFAIMLLAAICLTGCADASTAGGDTAENLPQTENASADDSSKQDAGGRTEIVYYTWGDEEGYMTEIVDAFNAQSDTTYVNVTFIPSTGVEYNEKVVSMLSSGSQMDLFSASNVKELVKYRDAGSICDLTDAIQSSGLDIDKYGTSFLETKKDEKFYGLPYRYSTMGLFYNKRIFEKEGIEVPGLMSWDEYAELAKRLTKTREDGSVQWGGFIPDWLGEPILTVQRGSSVMDPDTSALREWLELLGKLYNGDRSHMSFEEMKSTSTDWVKIFLAGDVAMLPNGEYTIGNVLQEMKNNPDGVGDFEMGVTYMPLPDGIEEPVTVGGPNTILMINQNTEHFENAFEFACFLCGQEGAGYLVENGMIPAYLDEDVIRMYKGAVDMDGIDEMLSAETHYECDPAVDFSAVDTIWREEKELYLIGEETLDQSMEMFEQRRTEVLGQ